MTTLPTLFDGRTYAPKPRGKVRHDAPQTSHDAADAIGDHLGELQRAVLDYIKERGDFGATDQEIQLALNLRGSTECPRRLELQEKGLVVASGLLRKTVSGRNAIVWKYYEL